VAIAINGGTLPNLTTTTITPGTAGSGNTGGDGNVTAQITGDSGQACKTLNFSATDGGTVCST
jgi:hypothetical protein